MCIEQRRAVEKKISGPFLPISHYKHRLFLFKGLFKPPEHKEAGNDEEHNDKPVIHTQYFRGGNLSEISPSKYRAFQCGVKFREDRYSGKHAENIPTRPISPH